MLFIYNGVEYDIDDELSFKDFTGHDFSSEDISGKVIYASCFSREVPNSFIFSQAATGVTFIKCNLSNCTIPDGNTVIDCQTLRFKCQNDGEDWVVDENGNPIEPVNKKLFLMEGRSIDPNDIPQENE